MRARLLGGKNIRTKNVYYLILNVNDSRSIVIVFSLQKLLESV